MINHDISYRTSESFIDYSFQFRNFIIDYNRNYINFKNLLRKLMDCFLLKLWLLFKY